MNKSYRPFRGFGQKYPIRVSTDKQITENQRFEILKFTDAKKIRIDKWVEETITTKKELEHRKLGELLKALSSDDILICSEISRIGRSLMEVMSILYLLMEKGYGNDSC